MGTTVNTVVPGLINTPLTGHWVAIPDCGRLTGKVSIGSGTLR